MSTEQQISQRVAMGALAGLLGTFLLQALRSCQQKVAPEADAPMKQDPGKFMVKKAESALPVSAQKQIPKGVENAAGKALGLGYGMMFGAFYALLKGNPGPILKDGVALGIGSWAVGYLGWLPATGLMPPISEQQSKQFWIPLLEHAAFGVATVASCYCMEQMDVLNAKR